jgi:Uma2 family endonuclease
MTALTLKSPVLERLTDEEFYQFCADNRDWRIERDANRQIYFTPPANSETVKSNNELSR